MENRIEFEGERVCISQEWYESLIEFRTKYITLTNFLFQKAEIGSSGKLSIYTNVADILLALEYAKTFEILKNLHEIKAHDEKEEKLPF